MSRGDVRFGGAPVPGTEGPPTPRRFSSRDRVLSAEPRRAVPSAARLRIARSRLFPIPVIRELWGHFQCSFCRKYDTRVSSS